MNALQLRCRRVRWRAISMISSGSIRPHLAVSIGDVSGKGLPAALLMAHIQASVRDVAHEAADAGTCVTMLNQRLVASTAPEKFVTLVYGDLRYTEPHVPVLQRGTQSSVSCICRRADPRSWKPAGRLLGHRGRDGVPEESVSLAAGEMLVLYTDGISEATNAQKELLGDERLAELCVELHGQPAGAVRDAILAAVTKHQGAEPAADDMTVLVIRRLPA